MAEMDTPVSILFQMKRELTHLLPNEHVESFMK